MSPLESFTSQRPTGHLKLITATLIIALAIALGYSLRYTLSCILLSFVIAYLLDPLIKLMEKRGIKRIHCIITIYAILFIITAFTITVLLPHLTIGWSNFLKNLPEYIRKLKEELLSWQNRLPLHYGSAEIRWFVDNITGNADKVIEKGGEWVYGFAQTVFFNIFNIVLSPILVFFMLHYKKKIMEASFSLIPESRRELIIKIGREINASIGGYIRGQVMVSCIVALLTAPALYMINIPHPLFCGIFAGFASILPFVGVILAMLPALAFAWLSIGTWAILLKVIAIFSLIYFIEGYLIKPLVFRESMNLNPLLTICMVMAMGELMGFWGILLALPFTAALKIACEHWLHGDFANIRNEP